MGRSCQIFDIYKVNNLSVDFHEILTMSTKILRSTYNEKESLLWSGERTMDHASGIWGRSILFQYLKSKITRKDVLVDLGERGSRDDHVRAETIQNLPSGKWYGCFSLFQKAGDHNRDSGMTEAEFFMPQLKAVFILLP